MRIVRMRKQKMCAGSLEKQLIAIQNDMVEKELATLQDEQKYTKTKELEKLTQDQLRTNKGLCKVNPGRKTGINYFLVFFSRHCIFFDCKGYLSPHQTKPRIKQRKWNRIMKSSEIFNAINYRNSGIICTTFTLQQG